MSASSRKTSWLKQNYEKVLLLVVLLGLLCSAVFLVWRVQQKTAEQAGVQPSPPFQKADVLDQQQLLAKVEVLQRTNLMDVTRGVMGDELRVTCINAKCGKPIPFEALVCPFCGAKQPPSEDPKTRSTLQDGIPDWWKKQYGFDILDAAVANADPDSDGFTNLEEFRAGTNPLDPKSHPDVASKLRVWSLTKRPFKLRFMAAMKLGASETFQLNLPDGHSKMVKIGEEAAGYKITAHEPDAPDGDVLVLENGVEKLRLAKNKDLQRFDLTAELVLMLDHKRYPHLAKDSSVKIREITYKIIDITTNAVTIRGPQPGSNVVVGVVSEEERAEVLGDTPATEPGAPAAPTAPAAPAVVPAAPQRPAVTTPPTVHSEGVVPQRGPPKRSRGF